MHKHAKDALELLKRGDSREFAAFLEDFCRTVPDADLDQLEAHSLLKIVRRHWDMARGRKPGKPAILVRAVNTGGIGADAVRTAVDVVNDDMPFLVDSVAAALTARERTIQFLMHPIVHDPKGAGQSHIHVELQGTLPESLMKNLESDLLLVLEDVSMATRDWAAMREALKACRRGLVHAPDNEAAVGEYCAFLDYLYDDNFTLLGFARYRFSEKDGKRTWVPERNSGLGLLSGDPAPYEPWAESRNSAHDAQALRLNLPPLSVSKLNRRSTVHRAVPLDAVTVRQYDSKGRTTGECLIVGLFTSVTYSRSIRDIPFLRRRADQATELSGFRPGSHDYKALRHILEKYPRDELFQMEDGALLETALSILQLQERRRIALYLRPDMFGRYISCLVYVPRDRYDTRLRIAMQAILETELHGTCSNFYTTLDDSPLARVMYLIETPRIARFSREDIERKLQETGKLWGDRLQSALRAAYEDERRIADESFRYGAAFPAAYTERYEPKQTVYDIIKTEEVLQGEGFTLDLYHDKTCGPHQLRLKIYSRGQPVTLSDALPVLENFGFRVISELPFEVRPRGAGQSVWVHDFLMTARNGAVTDDLARVKNTFEETLKGIWRGAIENDSLNELVVQAAMPWRDIQILRAYVRYMRQANYPIGIPAIERALTQNAAIASAIVSLFHARFSPSAKGRDAAMAKQIASIEGLLEKVVSLDTDRILRTIAALVQATLRTNFYQKDSQGAPKGWLSLKLDSRAVSILPQPRPFREIFVYSPRMEGIHLRMDWIARGGIRWSDRPEDFRTEILGLMKAQQVKNAVIVPMGAKGGFIVKHPPEEGGRAAFQQEGIECYKILVRGLLDITDNRKGTKIIPPKDVVRHDPDDPYLVVAADKGTASFSDIANGLSLEYGFWLGDAFASGGSAGYDHKGMGITARGAWESVKRHFREMDHDTQTQPFEVIGVGDMGGDVFGNGLLQSTKIRLAGAFNHVHIFCDPDPDPAVSFKERQRLFNEVKGWDQYDVKKLSKGGRIYDRSEKSLKLTPEIMARFDLKQAQVTPADLIQAMLRARTDLLFFGGIGTYIKASVESHADVGDKGNDSLRVDAPEIRAKVIGEGANLAVTQRARVEMAQNGIRLNTDFIDNSAGVDTSDHEVNIKILTSAVMENPKNTLTLKKRNALLSSMTDEVAALVLRDNYQQTQGLSLAELQAAEDISLHAAFIRDLERHSGLSRKLEALPDDEALKRRQAADKGLTRPELSVLLAHAKILFTRDLLNSDIPDHKDTQGWLEQYFPGPLRKAYGAEIQRHRLHREIMATALSNDLVNRMGPTFVKAMMDKTGAPVADVARAYLIVRSVFGLQALWDDIEALDAKVPASVQLRAMLEIAHLVERELAWFLTRQGRAPDIGRDIRAFGPGISMLHAELKKVAAPQLAETIARRAGAAQKDGLPPKLAAQLASIPALGAACDIIRIAGDGKTDIPSAARAYFEIGEFFHLDWLRQQAHLLPANDRWSSDAVEGLIEQLHGCQAGLTLRVLHDMRNEVKGGKKPKAGIVARWMEMHGHQAAQVESLLADMRKAPALDLPMLILAEQRLRHLFAGG